MPATRLGNNPQAVRRFDVLGEDTSTRPRFIRHLGLFSGSTGIVVAGSQARVDHMGPPLERNGNLSVSAWGTVPLNNDEVNQVQLWIDERINEYRAQSLSKWDQYIARPHVKDVRRAGGTIQHQQFSCAGFVIEALRDAGIDLIETDERVLPRVDIDCLRQAYPRLPRAPKLRLQLGLDGDGPWPVVLCGYVLHSLNRTEIEIRDGRYRPQAGDEYF